MGASNTKQMAFDVSAQDHPQGQTLHGLLEAVAETTPEKVSLRTPGGSGHTYREIRDAAKRCASHVVVFDGETVLLVADRSVGMLVSMLGVMRAGKAYCPVEPDFPASRVEAMVSQAEIAHALVPRDQVPQRVLDNFLASPMLADKDEFEEPPSVVLQAFAVADDGRVFAYHDTSAEAPSDADAVPGVVPDSSPAYVLFTSGSTGRPKGCCVPHRGSALYGRAVAEVCSTSADMTFLLKTPYVFDVHIQDIYSAFAAGATLVIAPAGAHKDAREVAELIASEGVNVSCFVPTMLVEFVSFLKSSSQDAAAVARHLRRVFCIGEALMTATCRELVELVPDVEIHNLYGPTEASVGVSHFAVTAATLPSLSEAVVPIGKPFGYVNFRVMDHARYEGITPTPDLLAEMADGEIGELFIGGDCLARGYINDAGKTAAAFFDFPSVQPRPANAASPFSLYKTRDLVRRRADGLFEYMGRSDFQVKIGGVRIECEEVSSVLKLHPAVQDALVTAFEGPFGKALAAYVVTDPSTDWQQQPTSLGEQHMHKPPGESPEAGGDKDLVSAWGAVYDEMYQDSGEGVSEGDPTLNWSGYIDTYSRRTHSEPVIKEWVERSCDLVLRHTEKCFPAGGARDPQRPPCVVELGCGNGMLLFRIAPIVAKAAGGRYIGTDISNSGLNYVHDIIARGPPYGGLPIETRKIAAHEVLSVSEERSVEVVLCNGVTMYFPSTSYLVECMQTAVKATADGGFSVFGDIQSKRHLMSFHADVQTFQGLRRPGATPQSVLRAARKAAATEQLSYFDDALFYRLEQAGRELFDGRLVRVEMGLKRGWWHSEFNRFRYDVELVVGPTSEAALTPPTLQRRSHAEACAHLGLPCIDEQALSGAQILEYVRAQMSQLGDDVEGFTVTLPNARVLRPVRLLAWLQAAIHDGCTLHDLPSWLHPLDMELGGSSDPELAKYGVEPEALFEMQLPQGWTQRVVWSEGDQAMLELVVLREAAAEKPWLSVVRSQSAGAVPSDGELAGYKNNQADYRDVGEDDSQKLCHDALRLWTSSTSLLPAMRPLVYVQLEEFPKNAAGKTDRGKLPDAGSVLEKVSDATALVFEAPSTEEEARMAKLWEEVLKKHVGVSTPFVAYGANSLVALSLSSKILSSFGARPDLGFLMSDDCTVSALVKQLTEQADRASGDAPSSIVRLSREDKRGIYLLIVGAAGTSAMTYQPIVEHFDTMQVYAVELPGRGQRVDEALESNFEVLRSDLQHDVERWAAGKNFVVWGDSLGAILAYELIVHMGDSHVAAGLLGLCVSGNSGPTAAAVERGMGESVQEYLDREVTSVADMTDEDWDKFFLAANAEDADSLREMLADPEVRRQAMGPLMADCGAYESYTTCAGKTLRCPILTLRGSNDKITAGGAMQTWGAVAGTRLEHRVLQGVGHMIAKEAPHRVAKIVENRLLPDFTEHLNEYRGFRAAYERLRRLPADELRKQPVGGRQVGRAPAPHFSPVLGASRVPVDAEPAPLDLKSHVLGASVNLLPMTPEVKKMRLKNAQKRLSKGALK